MPLVNMTDMLKKAQAGHYAVGAFNILDYNSLKAVVRAAEDLSAPVIIQTSVKTVEFWGARTMAGWAREIAEPSHVPVAIHLDHCKSVDFVGECIEAGWTSVMIDASSKPFEENLLLSRRVVEMAKPAGVSVEAELGAIGGVEDDISVADDDARLANPDKAEQFCRELPLDCFAPAIGTAHGLYKGEPRLDFDRLRVIAERTGVPLALHGGTGLSEEVFRKCIGLGCAKVNISTQLKHIFIDSFNGYHAAHPGEYNPLKALGAQFEALKNGVKEYIALFGGEGRV